MYKMVGIFKKLKSGLYLFVFLHIISRDWLLSHLGYSRLGTGDVGQSVAERTVTNLKSTYSLEAA